MPEMPIESAFSLDAFGKTRGHPIVTPEVRQSHDRYL